MNKILFSFAVIITPLHASSPFKINSNGSITFIYRGHVKKSIFIAGSFNSWNNQQYRLQKKVDIKDGRTVVFWSVNIKLPHNKNPYRYLYYIDGKWRLDPKNPQTEKNTLGQSFSLINTKGYIPKSKIAVKQSDGSYIFYYKPKQNEIIDDNLFLAGNFNEWNTQMYPLNKISDNCYAIRLYLSPGKYYYAFAKNNSLIIPEYASRFFFVSDREKALRLVVKNKTP